MAMPAVAPRHISPKDTDSIAYAKRLVIEAVSHLYRDQENEAGQKKRKVTVQCAQAQIVAGAQDICLVTAKATGAGGTQHYLYAVRRGHCRYLYNRACSSLRITDVTNGQGEIIVAFSIVTHSCSVRRGKVSCPRFFAGD